MCTSGPVSGLSLRQGFLSLFLLISTSIFPSAVAAQSPQADTSLSEVVVTASLTPQERSKLGSSVTVLTNEDLRKYNEGSVADVLRNVPGLEIYRSGSFGGQTSVRMRGLDPKYTKVLVDGIPVNDPTTIEESFDFANLSLHNVERIEVVRGPQSFLHGSSSAGGVINVITKQGEGPAEVSTSLEVGSFSTERYGAGVSGETRGISYSISGERLQTTGFSSANENRTGNTEEDGQTQETVTFGSEVVFSENVTFEADARHMNAINETDAGAGASSDDNSFADVNRNVARVSLLQQEVLPGLNHRLEASVTNNDRLLSNGNDFRGEREQYRYKVDSTLTEQVGLVAAVESRESRAEVNSFSTFDRTFGVDSFYGQVFYSPTKSLNLTMGGRAEDHSLYGNDESYRVTFNYAGSDGYEFHGSYGSGYKAPSLYQVYSNSGNRDLVPEESTGWDLGVRRRFGSSANLDVTYFSNGIEDLIQFVSTGPFTGQYRNVSGKSTTNGAEVSLSWRSSPDLQGQFSYTYTNAVKESGEDLPRVPEHAGSTSLTYDWTDRFRSTAIARYKGANEQSNQTKIYPYPVEEIDSYWVANVTGQYQYNERWRVTGRIQNLLDNDYEEIFGYGTPGLSGFFGIEATF